MSPQLLVAPGTGVPLLPFPYGPDYIKEPDYGTSPTIELWGILKNNSSKPLHILLVLTHCFLL